MKNIRILLVSFIVVFFVGCSSIEVQEEPEGRSYDQRQAETETIEDAPDVFLCPKTYKEFCNILRATRDHASKPSWDKIESLVIGSFMEEFDIDKELQELSVNNNHPYTCEKEIDYICGLIYTVEKKYDFDETTSAEKREKLETYMIRAYLKRLDPYASYYGPYKGNSRPIYGESGDDEYVGAGIMLEQEKYFLDISQIIKDSPAANSGLKRGDLIYRINDTVFASGTLSYKERKELLAGSLGDIKRIYVLRESQKLVFEIRLDVVDQSLGFVDQPRAVQWLGLGFKYSENSDGIKILWVHPNSPAEQAGIYARDVIFKIRGVKPEDLEPNVSFFSLIKGELGERIEFQIKRGSQIITVNPKFGTYRVSHIRRKIFTGGYGYIQLDEFVGNAHILVRQAYKELVAMNTGEQLSGLILDFRNNPGGIVYAAGIITDMFVDNETLWYVGKTKDSTSPYKRNDNDDILSGAPLVVLVNENSASASEVVSGALQDSNRAVIIGTKTFGKGSMQGIVVFEGTGLKMTISYLWRLDGSLLNGAGVTPDIIASEDGEPDPNWSSDVPELDPASPLYDHQLTEAYRYMLKHLEQ